MPSIGTIAVNLHTVDRDETVYAAPTNSVSHIDTVSLRRTMPKSTASPLRTNMRFERGFAVGATGLEKSVTVSIAVTAAAGVDTTDVTAYVAQCLTESASTMGAVAVNGDIHL